MKTDNLTNSLMNSEQDMGVLKESLLDFDREILDTLLYDRTSKKNILWATDEYVSLGNGYEFSSEIKPELLVGEKAKVIQPRISKSKSARVDRTKDKAEVYTPLWICNQQNNQIDVQWFGRSNIFNIEIGSHWEVINEKINFDGAKGNWKEYVDLKRMEVTCGEGPYLVSRYDTVTGEKIPLMERIGLFDRKMRIVEENAEDEKEWLKWSRRAVESIYAYEFQGDNLLLARGNMLNSYIEYYQYHFQQYPDSDLLKAIARIISWNLWQMDGMKCVIPGSCKSTDNYQISIFDFMDDSGNSFNDDELMCPGCKTGDIYLHTGIYCKIRDWRGKETLYYYELINGKKN